MADWAYPVKRTSPWEAPRARATILLVLAGLEIAWFAWFVIVPLPNARNIGQTVRRWLLAAYAIPGFVPGNPWRQSHLGAAVRELSQVGNLPQRIPIVLSAALIAAAAMTLGQLILRALRLRATLLPTERAAIAFGLGVTGLGTITLIVGRLGLIAPWPVRVGLGLLILGGWATSTYLDRRHRSDPAGTSPSTTRNSELGTRWWLTLALVVSPFLILMALGAMLPTIEYDALEYHLQGPKEYAHAGRIAFLPHNVYTSMPFGVEMLHLLGMEVLGDWWRGALVGQLLVMLHAPAAAILIGLIATRLGTPRAGWVAAAVYLTTPWIYRLAAIPYVEGPLCYYHAALIWTLTRAGMQKAESDVRTSQARASDPTSAAFVGSCVRFSALQGLLAGGAMACKYPALLSAVLPFGLLAAIGSCRQRSVRILLAFVAGWAVAVGPWLIKNVVDHDNPVYPLAYKTLGGSPWSDAREAKWSHAHGSKPFSWDALASGLMDIAGRSDWQSPLFTALVPLAFWRPGSRRSVLWLWTYAAYLFATWFLLTHRLDRFWIPILPVLAILAGLGADWTRSRAWTGLLAAMLSIGIGLNLVYISTALAGLNEWMSDLDELRMSIPARLNEPLVRLDSELPLEGVKILLVGQASVFHIWHEIRYNTVFDEEIIETIARDRSPAQIRQELHRRGLTHIYVDWHEIERHRKPGGYGFTPFVTHELFENLVRANVLEPLGALGPEQDLFKVR